MPRARSPKIFRILLQAREFERSRQFYEKLFGAEGRLVAPGRVYFDAGPVILGVLDYSARPAHEHSIATEAVYFATEELEALYQRAKELGCLTPGHLLNDPTQPAGEITTRPWGERSFYAADPAGNALCFVDADTKFTGTPKQIQALRERTAGAPAPPKP